MAPSLTMFDTSLACVALVVAYLAYRKLTSPNASYPPGPRPYPLIGNLLDVPPSYQERAFANLAKIFGMSPLVNVWSSTERNRGCDALAYLYEASHYPIDLRGCARVA